jgi:hypothetical protein
MAGCKIRWLVMKVGMKHEAGRSRADPDPSHPAKPARRALVPLKREIDMTPVRSFASFLKRSLAHIHTFCCVTADVEANAKRI